MSIYNKTAYDAQWAAKIEGIEALLALAEIPHPPPEVFSSPEKHYRLRAEFRLWHHEGQLDYAMFAADEPKKPIFLESFPPAARKINELMPLIKEFLESNPELAKKLFQVDFLTTTTEEALVTWHYHRPIDESMLALARELGERLKIKIILRAKKQKLMTADDTVTEAFSLSGRTYRWVQKENTFTQPNGAVNQKMLTWVLDHQDPATLATDLLELYCGNGNFTLPLCAHFRRVLATEVSKAAIEALALNQELNHVKNLKFARMSAAEMIAALIPTRKFNRLKNIDLKSYRFDTLFVDPPRSGLDPLTLDFSRKFKQIIYISCNPLTLKENLTSLLATHKIAHFALFDQFPYTPHCECGVILQRID